MSWLFKIEGKRVFPNAETLLINPFNLIWNRDESEDKWLAMREFAYIEFMTSQLKSNPYKGYSPSIRKEKIIEDVIIDPSWEPDFLIKQGMQKIEDFQTEGSENYTLLTSAMNGVEEVKGYLNTMDLSERTDKGAMVLKPQDVINAIAKLSEMVTNLSVLKKKVEEDLYDEIKTRANKVISPFADPNNI